MPDTLIRPMTSQDVPLFLDFYDSLSEDTLFFFRPHPRDHAYLGNLITSIPTEANTHRFLAYQVVNDRQVMVGYVFLWDMHLQIPWFGICVRDGFQGQGLGELMMWFAIDYAKLHDKGGILLTTHQHNLRGQRLYRKHGFETLGISPEDEFLMILRFSASR
jgi:ribosomal protein S18 acetylase RimI-like enzyme